MNYLWITEDEQNTEIDIKMLQKELRLSEKLCSVLVKRGFQTVEEIKAFLSPKLSMFHDPFLFKDMDKAVTRIRTAIGNQEHIVIYGDYDVDGMTSISSLYLCLKSLGANVSYYIPDRIDEGYGLNIEAIRQLKEKDTGLIITVDSGITGIEEAKLAEKLQMDLIITDHHTPGEILPQCHVILNPKLSDSNYPDTNLAGVGVTFKLIQALLGMEESLQYLDLVALGTIADMVPLLGENRIIAKHGLLMMAEGKRLGLKALLERAGLTNKVLTADHIGFMIAPKINAGGRIGNPYLAVELLITDEEHEAFLNASLLEDENERRRAIEDEIIKEAEALIYDRKYNETDLVLVVEGSGWHSGVIGIVASRILEKFHRPTIILSKHDEYWKGSARSIPGINIYDLLCKVSDHLIKFGGHTMAAGLTVSHEELEAFKKAINEEARKMVSDPKILVPKKFIDITLDEKDLNETLFREMKCLEPYGLMNPKPLVLVKKLKIKDFTQLGAKQNHLKIQFTKPNMRLEGIYFNNHYQKCGIFTHAEMDVVAYLEINEFNGQQRPQLLIKDLNVRYDGSPAYEKLVKNYSYYVENQPTSKFIEVFQNDSADVSLLPKVYYQHCEGTRDKYDVLQTILEEKNAVLVVNTFNEAYRAMINVKGYDLKLETKPFLHFVLEKCGQDENDTFLMLDYPFSILSFQRLIEYYGKRVNILLFSRADYNDNLTMLSTVVPDDTCLRNMFKLLRHLFTSCEVKYREVDIMKKYYVLYHEHLSLMQLRFCLDIFEELNLMRVTLHKDILCMKLADYTGKTDLNLSPTYRNLNGIYEHVEETYRNLLKQYL